MRARDICERFQGNPMNQPWYSTVRHSVTATSVSAGNVRSHVVRLALDAVAAFLALAAEDRAKTKQVTRSTTAVEKQRSQILLPWPQRQSLQKSFQMKERSKVKVS